MDIFESYDVDYRDDETVWINVVSTFANNRVSVLHTLELTKKDVEDLLKGFDQED